MELLLARFLATTAIQRYFNASLALLVLVLSSISAAGELNVHPGYLSSVKEERHRLSMEVVIVPPEEETGPTLNDQIFTDKLTRDFKERYENQFGRTQAEQLQDVPSRYFEKDLGNGQFISEEDYQERQEKFGNYMTKRLIEFHSDRYLKESPSGQRIYRVKESISNVTVKTKTGFSYKFRYNIASNDVTLKVENPYKIDSRLIFENSNTRLSLGYDVNKTVRVISDYETDNTAYTLSGIKTLSKGWSTSLTGTASAIEEKFILGFNWAD
jgi:hypothetical protein